MITCKYCKWWVKMEGETGECRGCPPQVIPTVGLSRLGVPEAKIALFFPRTTQDLYCKAAEIGGVGE